MSKDLIKKLAILKAQRNYVLRQMDVSYYDKKKRHLSFNQLQNIDNEIEKVEILLKIEKEIKNAKNNNT